MSRGSPTPAGGDLQRRALALAGEAPGYYQVRTLLAPDAESVAPLARQAWFAEFRSRLDTREWSWGELVCLERLLGGPELARGLQELDMQDAESWRWVLVVHPEWLGDVLTLAWAGLLPAGAARAVECAVAEESASLALLEQAAPDELLLLPSAVRLGELLWAGRFAELVAMLPGSGTILESWWRFWWLDVVDLVRAGRAVEDLARLLELAPDFAAAWLGDRAAVLAERRALEVVLGGGGGAAQVSVQESDLFVDIWRQSLGGEVPDLGGPELGRRLLAVGVLGEDRLAAWRDQEADLAGYWVDRVLARATREQSCWLDVAPGAGWPGTLPAAVRRASPRLALGWLAEHGPAGLREPVAAVLDAWVRHCAGPRMLAMLRSARLQLPAAAGPWVDQATGLLNPRTGGLRGDVIQMVVRTQGVRVNLHTLLLMARDVAKLGGAGPAGLLGDYQDPAYLALMEGSLERARVDVCLEDPGLPLETGGRIRFAPEPPLLQHLAVLVHLRPLPRDDWTELLRRRAGAVDDWFQDVILPATQPPAEEPRTDGLRAAEEELLQLSDADHNTRELLLRLVQDIRGVREHIRADLVRRDEVSHALRHNAALEQEESAMLEIRGQPLMFQYFEAFKYRMCETYAGCQGKLSGQVRSNSAGHKVNFGVLAESIPDVIPGLRLVAMTVLAPAIITMRIRSNGMANDFVRLASGPEEFAELAGRIAMLTLRNGAKQRQMRLELAREETALVAVKNIRASFRRMRRTRFDTTIRQFAVSDAQVLCDAIMEGAVDPERLESVRRKAGPQGVADILTQLLIQRTVLDLESQGERGDGALGVVAQAVYKAGRGVAQGGGRSALGAVGQII